MGDGHLGKITNLGKKKKKSIVNDAKALEFCYQEQ
jgi:hypothetical protein